MNATRRMLFVSLLHPALYYCSRSYMYGCSNAPPQLYYVWRVCCLYCCIFCRSPGGRRGRTTGLLTRCTTCRKGYWPAETIKGSSRWQTPKPLARTQFSIFVIDFLFFYVILILFLSFIIYCVVSLFVYLFVYLFLPACCDSPISRNPLSHTYVGLRLPYCLSVPSLFSLP